MTHSLNIYANECCLRDTQKIMNYCNNVFGITRMLFHLIFISFRPPILILILSGSWTTLHVINSRITLIENLIYARQ